ncbi:SUR7/PalI family domain containing protein [Lactarius tabidus]
MMLCWRRRGRFDDYDDYNHHHHRRNKRHATITGFLLFGAFLHFLFVALSLPIIKSIYLLEISSRSSQIETTVATRLRFGVWGFCASSALRGTPTECIGPQLGYTVNPLTIEVVTKDTEVADVILKGLTILLVLHPVAAGLTFLTLVPVTASCFVYHKLPWIISLVLSVPTAIVSTVVFAVDLALVIVARSKIKDVSAIHISIDFGNGIWMVLVSTLFTWAAMILLSARVCRCCGFGRMRDQERDFRKEEE